MRMTVAGHANITSAVATFGRVKMTFKGSLTEAGEVFLNGATGPDFVRIRGTADKSKGVITGSWSGTIDRKKVKGTFRLAR